MVVYTFNDCAPGVAGLLSHCLGDSRVAILILTDNYNNSTPAGNWGQSKSSADWSNHSVLPY